MKQWIADKLSPLSETLYDLLCAVPMGAVKILVFGILALLALWVLMLPPQLPESRDRNIISPISDLRLFALGVLVLQAVLYMVF